MRPQGKFTLKTETSSRLKKGAVAAINKMSSANGTTKTCVIEHGIANLFHKVFKIALLSPEPPTEDDFLKLGIPA